MARITEVLPQANVAADKATKEGMGYRVIKETIPSDGGDATITYSNDPKDL